MKNKFLNLLASTVLLTLLLLLLAVPLLSCSGPSNENLSTAEYELTHTAIRQPVDHNNPAGAAFDEEVNILAPRTAGKGAPVFFLLGNEHDILAPELPNFYKQYGSPRDVIFIQAEHRGYGQSITQDADQSVPGYIRIDQALADYHNVYEKLKTRYPGPWMAAGHSYGGGLTINYAATYPDDVKVILSSSGVVDWPFTMDAYDRQVRITMGNETYARLVYHINSLEPKEMFDSNWMEREFLIAFIHGVTQYGRYHSLQPLFKTLAALPTPSFMAVLHFIDDSIAQKSALKYAASNAKKSLTHDEAMTGYYSWRVWRYQQCAETGIFEISAGKDGVFNRSQQDFINESRAIFNEAPASAANSAWSPRTMLSSLKVPLVYVGGGMDPWMGLGLDKDYAITKGKYFYVADGQHCPDLDDVKLGRQVLDEMLKYAVSSK
jgi:pimeloyl-ACP methyl ester carboxylesterase